MAKFVVYAHDKTDVESGIIYVCTCDTEEIAKNITNALEYRDTGGRCDGSNRLNYYYKKEDWIV